MAFTIKVNGNTHSVDVDGDTPLLWVLRDVLGMTGTKFGCGMALCGACTVHVDGVADASCITPIDSVGTSAITTIEAIGATPAGAKIQKAWLDREVVAMRLLPVGPDHVGVGAAGEQPASDRCRHRRRDVRQHLPLRDLCPHSRSDQAGRAIERTGRLTMIIDHLTSEAASADRSPTANDLSRRSVPAGRSGRGRRPDAELQPAVRKRRSRSADADGVRAERLHPHRTRRADRPDHALCRDGPGHLHLDPDADRRRAGGGPEAGAAGACAAERKALRQSACWACRRPATRTRYAGRGSRCARPVRPREPCWWRRRRKRWNVDPASCRAQSGEVLHAPTGRRIDIWRACRRRGPHAGPRKRGAQAAEGFQAHRHAGQAARHAGEGQRNGRLRHRRSAAGREDRDACAIARLRRSREERGRCGGQGRQGRAPDRAARRRRRRRGRPHGGGEERARGAR